MPHRTYRKKGETSSKNRNQRGLGWYDRKLQLQWGATIKKRKHRGHGEVRGTHSLRYRETDFRLNVALNFGGNSASKVYLELFFFGQTRAGGDRAAKSVAPSVLSGRSCISSRRVSRVFPLLHLFSAGVRGGQPNAPPAARGAIFSIRIFRPVPSLFTFALLERFARKSQNFAMLRRRRATDSTHS